MGLEVHKHRSSTVLQYCTRYYTLQVSLAQIKGRKKGEEDRGGRSERFHMQPARGHFQREGGREDNGSAKGSTVLYCTY